MPPGHEDLARKADEIVGAMIQDLGGESELTAQKRAILASQRICLLVLMLAEEHLRGAGLLDKRGKPKPITRILTTFMNTLRLNVQAVGLERRAKPVESLQDILREYADNGEGNAQEAQRA